MSGLLGKINDRLHGGSSSNQDNYGSGYSSGGRHQDSGMGGQQYTNSGKQVGMDGNDEFSSERGGVNQSGAQAAGPDVTEDEVGYAEGDMQDEEMPEAASKEIEQVQFTKGNGPGGSSRDARQMEESAPRQNYRGGNF